MNYIDQFKAIYHITQKTILQNKELSFAENSALWKIKIKPLDNIINYRMGVLRVYYSLMIVITIYLIIKYKNINFVHFIYVSTILYLIGAQVF